MNFIRSLFDLFCMLVAYTCVTLFEEWLVFVRFRRLVASGCWIFFGVLIGGDIITHLQSVNIVESVAEKLVLATIYSSIFLCSNGGGKFNLCLFSFLLGLSVVYMSSDMYHHRWVFMLLAPVIISYLIVIVCRSWCAPKLLPLEHRIGHRAHTILID